MTGPVLFVGDVHLHPGGDSKSGRFLGYLRSRPFEAVYLMGDIFDYWIGPRHLDSADYADALDAFGALSRSGVKLYWIHGNRDYLIERRFAARTGARILGSEAVLRLGGRTVYAAHGDFLYNRNPDYSAYRRLMNFPIPQAIFTAIPAAVGKGVARGFKVVSRNTTPYRDWPREELVAGARRAFERGADVVICGHIHRPQHVSVETGGVKRDLFVLGDWDGTSEVVIADGDGFRLVRPDAG